ncbi:MAG TPA: hypothetical protein VFA20_30380 [Myxococcaceae bacterium]|nr:hypothetical protein [Myxococcaceae bacterium]
MTRHAWPLLLLLVAAGLTPGCFCLPIGGGCFIRDGDMMDCGPCPDDPAVTIPLPWAKTTNPRPAPQPPLAGAPSGDDAKPRTGTGTVGGADGQGSASGGSKAPSTR